MSREESSPYIRVKGQLVERDPLRIAEKINEYDPNLRVQALEGQALKVGEPPFRLVEKGKDGFERVVFTFWQLDDRVLQRVYQADTQIIDVIAGLDIANLRAKQEQNYRFQQRKEEENEKVVAILQSPKSTYKVDNTVYKA